MIAEAKAVAGSQYIEEAKDKSRSSTRGQAASQHKVIPYNSMLVLRNYEEVERLQKTLKLDQRPPPEAQAKSQATALVK